MGYTLLGKLVWRGGRWYLRRRYPDLGRKLRSAGITALVLAGVGAALVGRRRATQPG